MIRLAFVDPEVRDVSMRCCSALQTQAQMQGWCGRPFFRNSLEVSSSESRLEGG